MFESIQSNERILIKFNEKQNKVFKWYLNDIRFRHKTLARHGKIIWKCIESIKDKIF